MKWANEVKCPTCKGNVAMRISRSGFLRRRVLTLIGLYPWKCGACGTAFLYRRRGIRLRPGDEAAESGASHKHGPA